MEVMTLLENGMYFHLFFAINANPSSLPAAMAWSPCEGHCAWKRRGVYCQYRGMRLARIRPRH
jgi:hypothetical protein